MPDTYALPVEKLFAYQEARALLRCVTDAVIREPRLREQALRAALAVCLNVGEAAGRQSPADKARVYAIARGEASEACVALDIALAAGLCDVASATAGMNHARAAYALLSGLIRKFRSGASAR